MILRRTLQSTALAILACLATSVITNFAGAQELRRIEQPAEEAPYSDEYWPESEYESDAGYGSYQPSAFRFAELETSQNDPIVEDATYGGDYTDAGCKGCSVAVVGGVEATFLFPIIESGRASVQIDDNFIGFSSGYSTDEVKLDDDLLISPRIWFGVQHCSGWGVAARLFWMGDSDTNFVPDTPFFLQSHVATSRIQAYTFDAELTKSWCSYYGDERHFGIGFRYANIEAAELVEAHATINTDLVQGFAHTERDFDGSGFTLNYGGSKSCCSCCGVQLFFNFRGSALFGEVRNSAQTTAWAFDPGVVPGTASDYSTAVALADDVLFIGEVQVGARWEHQLQCCCARAFVSTAIEYQYWLADDAFAAAGSTAFTDDAQVTALATAGDLEVNMIGWTISTGLMW